MILVVLICMIVFVLIYDKANSPFVQDVMTAILAALITIVMTAILLRFQTDMEASRNEISLLYQEKFNTYNEFLTEFAAVMSEGKRAKTEDLQKLQASLYRTLLFIGSRESFDKIYTAVKDYLAEGKEQGLTKVVACLREELDSDPTSIPVFDKSVEDKVDELFKLTKPSWFAKLSTLINILAFCSSSKSGRLGDMTVFGGFKSIECLITQKDFDVDGDSSGFGDENWIDVDRNNLWIENKEFLDLGNCFNHLIGC